MAVELEANMMIIIQKREKSKKDRNRISAIH
jgi:hypothetical protein